MERLADPLMPVWGQETGHPQHQYLFPRNLNYQCLEEQRAQVGVVEKCLVQEIPAKEVGLVLMGVSVPDYVSYVS